VIRLPFSLFEQEDLADLRSNFPVFSVISKERALTDEQWKRLQLDKTTQAMEIRDSTGETAYSRRRDAVTPWLTRLMQTPIAAGSKPTALAPRVVAARAATAV
jgi:hypothetical protein